MPFLLVKPEPSSRTRCRRWIRRCVSRSCRSAPRRQRSSSSPAPGLWGGQDSVVSGRVFAALLSGRLEQAEFLQFRQR
jgi:hypothetical protein